MANEPQPGAEALDSYLKDHPEMKPAEMPGMVEFLSWQAATKRLIERRDEIISEVRKRKVGAKEC